MLHSMEPAGECAECGHELARMNKIGAVPSEFIQAPQPVSYRLLVHAVTGQLMSDRPALHAAIRKETT